MKASELYPKLGAVQKAALAVPLADYVVVQNGKLRYMGRALFTEVDVALPDLSLKVADLQPLVMWLLRLDDFEVTVTAKDKHIVFSQRIDDNATFVLSLNKPDTTFPNSEYYTDVDEVVLGPVLTHKYNFSLPVSTLKLTTQMFAAAGRHEDSRAPEVKITVNKGLVTFSVDSLNGSGRAVFRPDETATLPDQWEGLFNLAAFKHATEVYWVDEYTPPIKFSFKDNEKKELSALMVEGKENVVSVLSPLWK